MASTLAGGSRGMGEGKERMDEKGQNSSKSKLDILRTLTCHGNGFRFSSEGYGMGELQSHRIQKNTILFFLILLFLKQVCTC